MDLNMRGKTVVITGGATGIGKAAAFAFLKEGCNVAVCGRRQEKLDEAVAEARENGYSILAIQADVLSETECEEFAGTVADTYGKIDVWINNAGGNQIKSLVDYSADEFRRIVDLNLTSVFIGCKSAYPYLKETKGVILNAASFAALHANAGRAPYSAAKAGVLSLTRTFAAEFAKDEIRVLAYVPGMIKTDMTAATRGNYEEKLLADIPMRRYGVPEDLAKVLVFMASEAAGYVNGTYIEISGGKRCVQNTQYSYTG